MKMLDSNRLVSCCLQRRQVLVVLVTLAFLLASCAGSPSLLNPASFQASSIAGLFWSLFGIAAVIFIVTEALLVIALIRFRDRPGRHEPAQVHGNIRMEIAWTLAPAIILAGVFVGTVSTMDEVTRQQPNSVAVKVIGHQWWWEIQYPTMAITTATDLHVPVGQPVQVELVSTDVIHSFWVPELAGKTDVIPGHTNWLRFAADRPGAYRGQCAEYCGEQHANMGIEVIAEPRDHFDDWARRTSAPAAIPEAGPAARGAQALLGGICIACHTINGTPAQGKVGPNLTHFGSRRSIAALTIENTPENLKKWLSDTQAVKPGNMMRMPKLAPETIEDLVAYLESLK